MLKDLERDVEKLYTLHSNDAITEDEFKRRYNGLDKRKKQLLSTLEEKESQPASLSFIDRWHSLSEPHKRILVENLMDEIIVTPSGVTFSFYPLFNFAQQAQN